MGQLLAIALGLVLLGLVLVGLVYRGRRRRGLGSGETVTLDDVVLFSERLKLTGRPDRIVRQGDTLIPEEWKPSGLLLATIGGLGLCLALGLPPRDCRAAVRSLKKAEAESHGLCPITGG